MIKILFFIDTTLASGGAEKVLRTLVNNMDQTKFDITVLTAWPEDSEKYLASGIRYKSLFRKKNQFNRFRLRIESMLGLTYQLRIKNDYDIEIAYLENGPTKILASSTNKKAVKLAWVHCDLAKMADDPDQFAKKVSPWYSKFDKVICVSENVRESFVKLFGNRPESMVIHNCVDNEEILLKGNDELPMDVNKNKFTVTTVGRMYHQKGYDRLLRAHKRLREEGYDYDLWILGDGPERENLSRYIQEHSLEESVCLLGFRSNPYSFMAKSDIIVCSSRYEGFSTVVTEALILGKPVVTTDCSGMKELLGENEYGLIVENDEDGIYEGLKTLLDKSALLSDYKTRANQRGKEFSKQKLVKHTEDFLIEMLGVNEPT